MNPDEIPPGTHVEPNPENPWPVAEAVKPDDSTEAFFKDRDIEHRVPRVDLLHGTPVEPPIAGTPPSAPAVPTSQVVDKKTEAGKPRNMAPWWAGVTAVIVVLAAAMTYILLSKHNSVVSLSPTPRSTPSATSTPSPSPTPSLSPSPSPTPTPSATPVPQTVTVPTVAPSSSHPQQVTITSKSGLWLRNSPTSVNQSNVIDWMPDGAQVSVDAIGSFWWHGTYQGKAGYFASKYTQ
jgi:hypothetical protein